MGRYLDRKELASILQELLPEFIIVIYKLLNHHIILTFFMNQYADTAVDFIPYRGNNQTF